MFFSLSLPDSIMAQLSMGEDFGLGVNAVLALFLLGIVVR
jgi:hypothetical protein